ncbi:unnamed protein product [Penicillium olsonii]|uniref:DUF6536 domain-containing protein n=1 Tax=Penicillium olsonii TaxID=99116 RepID=A0A9W4N5Y0_PENOL|nr:unnamed protein product [Penicillium olsonii]CAG8265696.1 unnamed protein product [Penicillium olsonii]
MPSRLSPDLETAGMLEHTGDNDPYLTQIPLDTISPGASARPSHSSESSTIVRPSTSSSSNTAKGENLMRDTLPRFAAIGFLRQWFPEVDPEDPRTKGLGRKLSNRDVALIIHQSIAGVVLIFKIIVTTLAIRARGPASGAGGIVDVPEVTNCDQVRSYNMGLHLVINFLSTILLGSSNYCAQLLVAPTRKDIEQAHAKRRTLDIGIQSFRNLRAVDTPRRLLWVLLMISSGLLHLIWNTVVFAASPKVSYNVGVVTSDYLKDTTPWNYPMAGFDAMRQNVTGLTPISRAECIERYTNSDNGLSDVLLVARNISKHDQLSFAIDNSSSLLSNFSAFDAATNGGGSKGIRWSQANSWVCSAWTPLGYYASPPDSERTTICSDLAMKAYVDSWTFTRWEETPAAPSGVQLWAGVDHCIPASDLHPMDDICALRVSGTLLVIVCGLNLIKVICIFFHCSSPFKSFLQ